jgi:uncharacterized protein YndB with AHSA1/START domain
MPSVRTTTTISAPPEEVFDAFADGRRMGAWHPGSRSEIRLLTPGPIGKGSRFHASFKGSGEHDYELIEYDHPRRLVMRAPSPIGPLHHEVICEPVAGGTRLTQIGTTTVHDPRWLLAWLMRPLFAKLFRDSEPALRRYLEQPVPAAQPATSS